MLEFIYMSKTSNLYQQVCLDAIVVLAESNTFYLSGYASSNCQIVLTANTNYFITDMRYYLEATAKIGNVFEVVATKGDMYASISDILAKNNAHTVGWDNNISYDNGIALIIALGDKFCLTPIADQIAKVREVKTQDEIDKIIIAQRATEMAFDKIIKDIKLGVTEIEIGAKLEYYMLSQGCELAFESIVAFGKNTACPHYHRGETQLKVGDFITMDFGAKYQGYCSDMTRTLVFGSASDKQIEIYNIVAEAQAVALSNIKGGISAVQADAYAREVIEKAGYGEYFTHSLGHGVGIDIHEGITLSSKNTSFLQKNMVVTIEPGIYIPEFGGVRIEDMVVVEDDKVVNLTQSNKKLIII